MATIDFKHFTVPVGITGKRTQTGDARETFADIVYTNLNGIGAHALALKIYQSDGPTRYTDEETRLITSVAERHCTPAFIDGLRRQMRPKGRPASLPAADNKPEV